MAHYVADPSGTPHDFLEANREACNINIVLTNKPEFNKAFSKVLFSVTANSSINETISRNLKGFVTEKLVRTSISDKIRQPKNHVD